MAKNKKKLRGDKNQKKRLKKKLSLPTEIKQMILGVVLILLALIIVLAFFNLAGAAGKYLINGLIFLIGNTVFLAPLVLVLAGLVFLTFRPSEEFINKSKKIFWPVAFAGIISLVGLTGFLGSFEGKSKIGGWVGYIFSWPFLTYFGHWVSFLVFGALIAIGGLIFYHYLKVSKPKKDKVEEEEEEEEEEIPQGEEKKQSIISKFFAPKFRVSEVPHFEAEPKEAVQEPKTEPKSAPSGLVFNYQPPPLNLLDPERGSPMSGDTKVNASIIKKTLQNFNIDVAMSEVNIGPTVTQYTFKPSEGIKLSKITGLSNDLALALAAHPIRIEAPIPGRSLVGVELPNKGRAEVRLRNLIENESFQKSDASLNLALGRDVGGTPVYTDMTKMPHLLVAGATGAGKTIFLNTLILSLLYQPNTATKSAGPETLRLIMIDPKRVEFPVYGNIPHLLCPILYNADQTIGALRWLTGEMERRFDVLASENSRNIQSFNEKALRNGTTPLPFIIVIIDELADLMLVRGKEIEGGIVRLAQMARAVGIHLVVATQRPSVEVITGLIKANITSRITFQVASSVDSRTIIDTSGAEKLLGAGDMLYISSYTPKPKRIQGAYVSEKEVKKVIKYINDRAEAEGRLDKHADFLESVDKGGTEGGGHHSSGGEYTDAESDPLFNDAKNIVIEANKASASLLQRRLRVGYARAARLIDMLEDVGVVGPAHGAKPREIYGEAAVGPDELGELDTSQVPNPVAENEDGEEANEEWKKI